jgi:hypothetical protein
MDTKHKEQTKEQTDAAEQESSGGIDDARKIERFRQYTAPAMLAMLASSTIAAHASI